MPPANRFQHQSYESTDRTSRPSQLSPRSYPPVGSDAFGQRMRAAGAVYRRAGVRHLYLVHGTFVGSDALGVLAKLARVYPQLSKVLARLNKRVVDRVAGEAGNYTAEYAQTLEAALNARADGSAEYDGADRIQVKRFLWSSQNHHIGRADGAVRLVEELATLPDAPRGRVMLWGHSHAGNVFALLSNLLAAPCEICESFFRAARCYYRWPLVGWVDVPVWQQVRDRLARRGADPVTGPLDMVTFGTPVRYGWDTSGYDHLLHVINHRPSEAPAEESMSFPPDVQRVLTAADGDYVQQFGIAGTNLMPTFLSPRSCWADWRLGRLLQSNVRRRDLLEHLAQGRRVPAEGQTLLVDYGPPAGDIAHHVAGHAVYTRSEWMLLHAELAAERFYNAQPEQHRADCA